MTANGRKQPIAAAFFELIDRPLLVKADIAAKYIPELTAADCM
jgi:hypothetical protein